ncbi:TPA: phage tail protein [Escherichia coli]|nr:phage tail protein [Escherichia coli]
MADSDLRQPVVIQATRLDATVLPAGFSQAFTLYMIQQGQDFGNVAAKANDAGQGAYDAQQKNEEQDLTLANHDDRISKNEADIKSQALQIAGIEGEIKAVNDELDALELNVVTKSSAENQLIQQAGGSLISGPIPVASQTSDKLQSSNSVNALVSYKVQGVQVVGARVTGFTAATGDSLKGAFNVGTVNTVGTTYNQSEVQAIANGAFSTRRRLKALEDAMRSHGLID